MDCHLPILYLTASCDGVMHEADEVYSIRSTWLCYWLDHFLTIANNTWIFLEIFNFLLDLPSIYFSGFSGC